MTDYLKEKTDVKSQNLSTRHRNSLKIDELCVRTKCNRSKFFEQNYIIHNHDTHNIKLQDIFQI